MLICSISIGTLITPLYPHLINILSKDFINYSVTDLNKLLLLGSGKWEVWAGWFLKEAIASVLVLLVKIHKLQSARIYSCLLCADIKLALNNLWRLIQQIRRERTKDFFWWIKDYCVVLLISRGKLKSLMTSESKRTNTTSSSNDVRQQLQNNWINFLDCALSQT